MNANFPTLVGAVLLSTACAQAPESPTDLTWLRRACGDGALVHVADQRLYLTELATGESVFLGNGTQPEFSPDGTKVAWIDGRRAVGRLRHGGEIHVIATGVEPRGGVHWLNDREVAVVIGSRGRRVWYRVALTGERSELPELTKLGTGGTECDVRLGDDGVWSYVAKRSWRTSDGRSGRLPGTCSVSLSLDGRSATSLHNPHKECTITAIRPGGQDHTIWWPYAGGYDNHRFTSNDPRFIVAVDEHTQTMVVMTRDGKQFARVGTLGHAEHQMYGDFTVGAGRGGRWPAAAREPAPDWPVTRGGLEFVWTDAHGSNTVRGDRLCRVVPSGRARFAATLAMNTSGGVFEVERESAAPALAACSTADALTLGAVVTPTAAANDRSTVIEFGRAISLEVVGGTLTVNGRALAPFRSRRPHRIVVAYGDGTLRGYVDGSLRASATMRLDLAESEPGLRFGDGTGAFEVEAVALYARALDESEVEAIDRNQTDRVLGRKLPIRTAVDAVLERKRAIPDPKLYPNALVVYDYEVVRVLSGRCSAKRVQVVHWGALNRQTLPVGDRAIGGEFRLLLEPFEDHPELAQLRIAEDGVDPDLAMFHDVASVDGN